MMENYLYIMYNQINKAMQKIMRSLFIATLLLVSMGMGAYAQETKKTFTPEQQEMIDLSNAKWKWMSEKDVDKLDACLLYTSPSPRDKRQSRMPSSA